MSEISLRDHFKSILEEMDRRYMQRFTAQEQAVSAALSAAKEAVTKAEVAAEKRFDAVNEFRATLSDQQTTFARRDIVEEKIAGLTARVDLLTSQSTERKGRGDGIHAAWGYLLAVIMAGVALAALFFKD